MDKYLSINIYPILILSNRLLVTWSTDTYKWFHGRRKRFLSVLAKWYSDSHRIFWDFVWIYSNFKNIFFVLSLSKNSKMVQTQWKKFLICARPCFIQRILNQVPTTSRTFSYKNIYHHYVFLVGKIWFLNNLVHIAI